MCTFALLLAPCFPLLPRGPAPAVCPSLASCQTLFFWFFFGCPPGCALRCSRAPCVCPLLFSVLPLSRCPVPPPGPVSPPFCRLSGVLPVISDHPHCLCRAVTRVCHPRALPLPPSVVPTRFSGGSPTFVFFLWSLSLSSSGRPWFTVCGGEGFTCGLDCGPARGRVRRWRLGFDDRDVPHAARTSEK